jgi:hypothetical protein
VPTRWQVTLPPNWVVLAPEGGPGTERTWGRQGWLLRPRLAAGSADLEAWFAGPQEAPAGGEERPDDAESAGGRAAQAPGVVCWRDGGEPLVLTHAPLQAWLLVCSLGLLSVGLGVSWLAWRRDAAAPARWVWPVLALVALGAVVAGMLWPTVLSAVAFGCEPGAVVLVLVAGLQWLLQERFRRQIIYLPSFSRPRGPGSSLRPGDGSGRTPGEPSTVDAPRPNGVDRAPAGLERRGSSVERSLGGG